MTQFLTQEEVLFAHEAQIERFGGTYLHADHYEMAAAYLFPIVSNHPFVDGNKRAGMVAALTFLDLNGYWFDKKDDGNLDAALESLVLSVACGEMGKEEIAEFFRKHCPPV